MECWASLEHLAEYKQVIDLTPDVLDLLDKSFALELFHVLVRHALDLFVPIFSHWNTPPVKMVSVILLGYQLCTSIIRRTFLQAS